VLRKSFGSEGGSVIGNWRKSRNRELYYTLFLDVCYRGEVRRRIRGEAWGARVGGENVEVFGEET
jgi:hypothetical protein